MAFLKQISGYNCFVDSKALLLYAFHICLDCDGQVKKQGLSLFALYICLKINFKRNYYA